MPYYSLATDLILQVPDAVLVCELLVHHSALGQDAHFKPAHVEEEVGIVLAVHGHKARLPLDGRDGTGKTVLDLPENSTTTFTREKKCKKCKVRKWEKRLFSSMFLGIMTDTPTFALFFIVKLSTQEWKRKFYLNTILQ